MPSIKISDSQKIEVSSFRAGTGELFLNVRKFYKTKGSEEWLPTKQGITIPVEKALKFRKVVKDEQENIEERAVDLEPRGSKKKSTVSKKKKG